MNGSQDFTTETLRKISASMAVHKLILTEDSVNDLRVTLQETVEKFFVRSRHEKSLHPPEKLISIGAMHALGPFDGTYQIPSCN